MIEKLKGRRVQMSALHVLSFHFWISSWFFGAGNVQIFLEGFAVEKVQGRRVQMSAYSSLIRLGQFPLGSLQVNSVLERKVTGSFIELKCCIFSFSIFVPNLFSVAPLQWWNRAKLWQFLAVSHERGYFTIGPKLCKRCFPPYFTFPSS